MQKKHIIVIDDDKIILKITKKAIEDGGFTASTFSSPKEGLEYIKDNRPDALILDRTMPEMDGNDVIHALQSSPETRDIPIMMLTARGKIDDITASLGLGARDYIVKPFDQDNFLIRLKKIMGMF